jgi:hypothetical protein
VSPAIAFPEEHVALGALAVLILYVFAPGRLGDPARPHPNVARYLLAAFVVVVFLKELLWDPVNEVNEPFLWSGVADLSWYLVGTGAMLGFLWARFRHL